MYLCGLVSDIFCVSLHFPGRKTEAQGTEGTSLHLWLEGHPRKHLQKHSIEDFTCANPFYWDVFSRCLSCSTSQSPCLIMVLNLLWSRVTEVLISCLSIRATLPLYLCFPAQALDKMLLSKVLTMKKTYWIVKEFLFPHSSFLYTPRYLLYAFTLKSKSDNGS